MPRTSIRIERRAFITEQIDANEHAGDEFACLDDNDCINDSGHLFKTRCGETKCVWCPKVVGR